MTSEPAKIETRNTLKIDGEFNIIKKSFDNIFSQAEKYFEKPYEVKIIITSINNASHTIKSDALYSTLGSIGTKNIKEIQIDIYNSYNPEVIKNYILHKRIWININSTFTNITLLMNGEKIDDNKGQQILNAFEKSLALKKTPSMQEPNCEKSHWYHLPNYIEINKDLLDTIYTHLTSKKLKLEKIYITLHDDTKKKIDNITTLIRELKEKNVNHIELDFSSSYSETPYHRVDINIPLTKEDKISYWIFSRGDESIGSLHDTLKIELDKIFINHILKIDKNIYGPYYDFLCSYPVSQIKIHFIFLFIFFLSKFLISPLNAWLQKSSFIYLIFLLYTLLTKIILNLLIPNNIVNYKSNVINLDSKIKKISNDVDKHSLQKNLANCFLIIGTFIFIAYTLSIILDMSYLELIKYIPAQ